MALAPVLLVLLVLARNAGWSGSAPDALVLLLALNYINAGLLLFNLLPVYPLDGGQILRSLLWFVLGRARSLLVATAIGLVGTVGLALWAVRAGSVWLGILAFFVGTSCWNGFKQARALAQIARLPRRPGVACPSCGAPPLLGALWVCGACEAGFDAFETGAQCPACHSRYGVTRCADCGRESPLAEWLATPAPRG